MTQSLFVSQLPQDNASGISQSDKTSSSTPTPARHEMSPFRGIIGSPIDLTSGLLELLQIESESNGRFLNHQARLYQINQALDVDAFSQAVRALTDSHALFRTAFTDHPKRPALILFNAVKNPLQVIDLSTLTPKRASDAFAQRAAALLKRPFSLQNAPLCRLVLFRHTEQQFCLLAIMHPLLADDWDDAFILETLPARYSSFIKDTPYAPLKIRTLDQNGLEELADPDLEESLFGDELADWLDPPRLEERYATAPITKIQEGSPDIAPFFYIHGLGGGVLDYGELARLVGTTQPAYGVLAPGANGSWPQHTLPDTAAACVKAIKTVQPHGPYMLGGTCYGGVVAFEMACQLEADGDSVALLGIFEGEAPLSQSERKSWRGVSGVFSRLFESISYWVEENRQLNQEALLSFAWRRTKTALKKWLRRMGFAIPLHVDEVIEDVGQSLNGHRALMRMQLAAKRRYRAGKISSHIALFRSDTRLPLTWNDPRLGWQRRTRGTVSIHRIEGKRFELLKRPYVASLAAALRAEIDGVIA